MSTIVLVNPPNKNIVFRDMYSSTISKGSYNWPNVDLLVISAILKSNFNVVIIDANAMGYGFEEAADVIAAYQPKGVCCSIGASVKDDDYNFIALLRQRLPKAQLVGLGGLLLHNPEHEMQLHQQIDACLLNFTTNDITKYFCGQYDDMNNIVYRKNEQIIRTETKYPENGFTYPVPLHEQLPLKKYYVAHGQHRPLSSVITSYGCPGRCNFCVAGGIKYRYRDPQNVIDELHTLKRLGVKEIFFRDNTFCANKKQGRELMELMIKSEFSFSWLADTRADVLDEQTVDMMKRSGCCALHIGVESASQNTLDKYDKSISKDQIRKAFKMCKKYDIHTVGYFILGLPGESFEDTVNTIDYAIELDCDYASFNVPIPIYGTPLREEVLKQNWLESESVIYDGSLDPAFKTDLMLPQDIIKLSKMAYRRFYLRPSYCWKAFRRIRNWHQCRVLFSDFLQFIRKV